MSEIQGYIPSTLFDTIYSLIYTGVAFVALLFSIGIDYRNTIKANGSYKAFLLFFSFLFVGVVGLREYNVGTDTEIYYFQWIEDISYETPSEIIFYLLMKVLKSLSFSFSVFLTLVAFLFFYFINKGLNNISIYYKANIFIVFFATVSLFFISSLSINIIRQGLSLSLLFYSYSLWALEVKSKRSFSLLILSFLVHTTSIIPILIFTGVTIFAKRSRVRHFVILYFIGIILSLANFGLLNIVPFVIDFLGNSRRIGYFTSESDLYSVGFKPQFVVFNTVFLIMSLYIYRAISVVSNHWKRNYSILLKYFIVTSFLFFMAFQIPYSDRWGLFSWIAIPVLMAPYFSCIKLKLGYKTPMVLLFIAMYIFFELYTKSK